MSPGQLSNSLLDNFRVGPGFSESTHVEQVGTRKAFHFRKGGTEVAGKAFDDFGTPALRGLTGQNLLSNLLVKRNDLTIDREGGALLRLSDAGLEVRKPCRIITGD